MSIGSDVRWRVFVSHTSELREFPRENSYVAEVERAISAAGHVVVDMRDFPAADLAPAQLCTERVGSCEVYVGLLGTRYGSPVRGRPEVSYTELEFDTATEAGLDRLVFLLDTNSENVGIPPAQLVDRRFGDRQDAFRNRVRDGGLTVQPFGNAAKLGQLVERSLRELAETRRRMAGGLRREQVPAESRPVRASKFVNPPPATAPTWFQDRQVETGLIARYVTDPGIRLVTVVGRGGVGKTAMACRLLKALEAGQAPDTSGRSSPITVGGIVYLSRNGAHHVDYQTLVADTTRLLPDGTRQRLAKLYQERAPAEVMEVLLEAFPAGDPVVVLLDNLESVMDATTETLTESALREALTALLTAPAHAVTVIATTRVTPTGLLGVEPGAQRQLRLDEGLGPGDAETVLRELDQDGALGLRHAPTELLDGLRHLTRGFPRALEAVKAILDLDRTLTPRDLLNRTRDLPEDRVVEVLVGEAYELLDPAAQQVMQALAVYPSPVSTVGVDFLIRPFDPTTNAAPILARLVRRQLVRFHDGQYHLHPVDRDYALDQIPAGAPGDPTTAYTRAGLRALAADYFTQIRTPRDSWHSLDDIQPQLAEFELRCAAGDYDTAATVLADLDFDYLRVWGHYRTAVDLHRRIQGHITDPTLHANHLINLGISTSSLGDYRQAIDLHTQALRSYRETGSRDGEAAALTNVGLCHYSLGDYRQALDLHTQTLDIYRVTGNRNGEAAALGNMGLCTSSLGESRQAIDLHTQALAIYRETGNRDGEAADLNRLGGCHSSLGDSRQAIDLHTQALAIYRETGNRDGEADALGRLGRRHYSLGDYRQAIDQHTQALAIYRQTGNPDGEAAALGNSGLCHASLGDYRQAIDQHTQALAIYRQTGNRDGEAAARSSRGLCAASLGDYRQAIDQHTEALASYRRTGNRNGEAAALGNLGLCHYCLGDYELAIDVGNQALAIAEETGDRYLNATARDYLGRAWLAAGDTDQALSLLNQAVDLADSTGDVEPAVEARSGLARTQLELGDPEAARTLAETALQWRYPTEQPTLLLLKGIGLTQLGRTADSGQSFQAAISAADTLLELHDGNVAALHARALALCGLAVATGDPANSDRAATAFARAWAATTAAGVTKASLSLLDQIKHTDQDGILTDLPPLGDGSPEEGDVRPRAPRRD